MYSENLVKPILLGTDLDELFWSFFGFWGILVIFWVLRVFGYFLGFGGILVIFRFRRYFGHFLGFGGILIIFRF